jgi:hypothetical protein
MEELSKSLGGWTRTSDYNFQFERTVGGIRQTLFMSRQQEGDDVNLKPGQRPKEITAVHVSEWPPEDGSVPSDWPTQFKRGIYRVIPDQLALVRGLAPAKIATSQNPIGEGAEAYYTVRTSLAAADAAVKKQLGSWKRVDAKREIRYASIGNNPVFQRKRKLNSVTLREKNGTTEVVVRWTPGLADRVGYSRSRGPLIEAKPEGKVPKALTGDFGKALRLRSNDPSIRILSWEYTLPTSYRAITKKLRADGIKVVEPNGLGVAHLELGSKAKYLNVTIRPGRTAERRTVPQGWQPTPDFAGFVDYVTVDEDRAVQVGLIEGPRQN